MLGDGGAGLGAEGGAFQGEHFEYVIDGGGEMGGIVGRDQEAGGAVGDGFGSAAVVAGDDDAGHGLGLDVGAAEGFGLERGGDDGVGDLIGGLHVVAIAGEAEAVGDAEFLGEFDEFAGELAGALLGAGEDEEGFAVFQAGEGLDGDFGALPAGEAAGEEDDRALLGREAPAFGEAGEAFAVDVGGVEQSEIGAAVDDANFGGGRGLAG